MKKGSKLLIGFSVAAITFGTLMTTLGPQKFGAHCSGNWVHYGHNHCYHHCGS